jgi:hypothetical protein
MGPGQDPLSNPMGRWGSNCLATSLRQPGTCRQVALLFSGKPRVFHVHCKRGEPHQAPHLASPSRCKAFLLGWLLVFWLVPEQISGAHIASSPCGVFHVDIAIAKRTAREPCAWPRRDCRTWDRLDLLLESVINVVLLLGSPVGVCIFWTGHGVVGNGASEQTHLCSW